MNTPKLMQATLIWFLAMFAQAEASTKAPGITSEEYRMLSSTIGGCKGICYIYENPGGDVDEFRKAALIIKKYNYHVVIKGGCYSACTVFADFARPRVCITKSAAFHFHLGWIEYVVSVPVITAGKFRRDFVISRISTGEHFVPKLNRDVKRWVMKHGGFPLEGYTTMTYKDAGRFWPTCK